MRRPLLLLASTAASSLFRSPTSTHAFQLTHARMTSTLRGGGDEKHLLAPLKATSVPGGVAAPMATVQPGPAHVASGGVEEEVLRVKKLTEDASLPVRGSKDSAGFDLASAYDIEIPAGGKGLLKTELAIAIPPNTYARIAPRSGLACKMIDVGAGVVDYDYRGHVRVLLYNFGQETFKVSKGDRIAQLILERICMASVEEVGELPDTERGEGGFGSTGVSGGVPAATEPDSKRTKTEDNTREASSLVAEALVTIRGLQQELALDWVALGGKERAVGSLKTLALQGHCGLLGALEAYRTTQDGADLSETLALILLPMQQ